MINYTSAVNVLAKAGYYVTNKCNFDGEVFHDFNATKRDASVSLVIDESTGAVIRAEVTTRKWSDNTHRYEPTKQNIYDLQTLIEKFAPRTPMSL
jgi:hypothetical protein